MRESSTYQYILEEGMKEGIEQGIQQGMEQGRAEEARRLLLSLGNKRFGEPEAQTLAILEQVTSIEALETLVGRLLEVESWAELLAGG